MTAEPNSGLELLRDLTEQLEQLREQMVAALARLENQQ